MLLPLLPQVQSSADMQFMNMKHRKNKVARNGAAQYIEFVSSSLLKKLDLTRSFNVAGFFSSLWLSMAACTNDLVILTAFPIPCCTMSNRRHTALLKSVPARQSSSKLASMNRRLLPGPAVGKYTGTTYCAVLK
jgi:hypothetical protein